MWIRLIIVLLGMDPLRDAMAEKTWLPELFRSPWWLIADATIAGALIDIIATRLTGVVDWPGSGVSANTSG